MGPFTTGRVFAFGVLLFLPVPHSTKAQQKAEWTWKDKDGKTHTRAELDSILQQHEAWLASQTLTEVHSFLQKLEPWVASQEKAGIKADLADADLIGGDLTDADLREANLKGADLSYAHLNGANLTNAQLEGAGLISADFTDAHVEGAYLSRANLMGALLTNAVLTGAHMNDSYLTDADLSEVDLEGADLTNADLNRADLTRARLYRADLTRVNLSDADLNTTFFEPKSLPETRGIAAANSLESLTYMYNPDALVQLRKIFADEGFREQERKITYALKRREAELSWEGCKSRKTGDKTRAILWSSDSSLANCGSFILNRVFFDWTCEYGMSSGRPLSLGVLVWLLCSLLYFVCIHTSREEGLYRVYAPGIRENPSDARRVERISASAFVQTGSVRQLAQFFRREWSLFCTAMFFSLMSAFNIGFRDINFGRWLRLLTRQEFDIKAVGWARVIAGWQSLISVYFIALWVLTYFGRPFG